MFYCIYLILIVHPRRFVALAHVIAQVGVVASECLYLAALPSFEKFYLIVTNPASSGKSTLQLPYPLVYFSYLLLQIHRSLV